MMHTDTAPPGTAPVFHQEEDHHLENGTLLGSGST